MTPALQNFGTKYLNRSDEDLAELVQCFCLKEPWQILWLRHYRDMNQWVAQFVRRRLPDSELEDAQQGAHRPFFKAVFHYHVGQRKLPGGCSFRTFLYCAVRDWCKDYLKSWWRHKTHEKRPVFASDASDEDPVAALTDQEDLECFRACFNGLGADEKHLWYLLSWGLTEKWIAWYEEVSLDALRRRRRKLLAKLRRMVGRIRGVSSPAG